MMSIYERQANIRGLILRVLKDDPDQKLSDVSIATAVKGYGYDEIDVNWTRREINFLEGRGYISKEVKNHSVWIVSLQPKGVDLLEGREEDHALNLPPV